MKLLIACLLFVTFAAQARVFECRDGEEVETLTINNNIAKIQDYTLKNMLRVDWNLPIRVYSFINDPWFNLEVDTPMLNGHKGYARLEAHELTYGNIVYSKFYECTPK